MSAPDPWGRWVRHVASGRWGRVCCEEARRFGWPFGDATPGAWVMWTTHSRRPSWHPLAVLETQRDRS